MDSGKAFEALLPFTCNNVPMSERRMKWLTWKRGFDICLRAAKLVDASEKKDQLLAHGGFELQEVFYGIPGADVIQARNVYPYDVAITKLNEYFAPQRHEAHERYLFWNMKPEPEETLGNFVMRAQMHVQKCNFGKSAIESSSIAVVDKMLQFVPLQERELSVQEVIRQVNAYETTKLASEQISGKASVQPMAQQALKPSENLQRIGTVCKYCGGSHRTDQQCPAWNKTCSGCGKRGHFRRVCFSRSAIDPVSSGNFSNVSQRFSKRNYSLVFPSSKPAYSKRRQTNRQLNAIEDTDDQDERFEFVDMVATTSDTDELIWASVGNVLIEMQIDSGVYSNIIDDHTWR